MKCYTLVSSSFCCAPLNISFHIWKKKENKVQPSSTLTPQDPKLRGLAYVAVGKIGRRSPHRLNKDIQIVQTFFDALCQVSFLLLCILK